jgi:hypothetical protein
MKMLQDQMRELQIAKMKQDQLKEFQIAQMKQQIHDLTLQGMMGPAGFPGRFEGNVINSNPGQTVIFPNNSSNFTGGNSGSGSKENPNWK